MQHMGFSRLLQYLQRDVVQTFKHLGKLRYKEINMA
jgi:hypothetical protein